MSEFVVRGVPGLPEVEPGADVAALIAEHADLADGDIVAITSKIVSKAEGRARKGADRDTVIDDETARVVAEWTTPRGRTRIAQTHHGFVLAAAGVDESNVAPGTIVPLPVDPDGSARRIRTALHTLTGARVGVLITDTAGRPWRDGQVDFAIGAAGLRVRDDLRGQHDSYGNELGVTVVAVADELAATTELVRRKLDGMPVALVRGLAHLVTAEDGPGAAALVRPAEEDRFRLGTPEAMQEAVRSRPAVTSFTSEPIDRSAIQTAVSAAAPAYGGGPWRFVLVETASTRLALCDAMLAAWVDDLRADGLDERTIADRTAHGRVLRDAPYLIVPCLLAETSRTHADERRSASERASHLLSAGGAIERLLLSLSASGLGTHWSAAALYCQDAVRASLDLPGGWEPMGVVAVGHAAEQAPQTTTMPEISEFIVFR